MPGITAGKLRYRIILQELSSSQDATGAQVQTWSTIAEVWGDISPLSGRELFLAQAVQSAVTHEIVIRYETRFSDPKYMAKLRAVVKKDHTLRIFNILSSRDEEEARRNIILDAQEGLNYGG